MNEDWQVGDLALCVKAADPVESCDPPVGSIQTVEWVWMGVEDLHTGEVGDALDFVGVPRRPGDVAYDADRFRRIPPLTDEEHRQALEDLRVPEPVAA